MKIKIKDRLLRTEKTKNSSVVMRKNKYKIY